MNTTYIILRLYIEDIYLSIIEKQHKKSDFEKITFIISIIKYLYILLTFNRQMCGDCCSLFSYYTKITVIS